METQGPQARFKKALIEHIFRSVWAQQDSTAEEETDALDSEDEVDESHRIDSTARPTGARTVSKISRDALKLSCEFLRLFLVEALQRAQMEALIDDQEIIEPHHIEQILAQLLLDF